MTFKYRALTANCGNDAIGKEASSRIAKMMKEDDADFYLINCQEVAFDKTRKQLQAALGPEYSVKISDRMDTHTKLSTQFHSGTGITTFVIHKNKLNVEFSLNQIIRRSASRVGGSGYNKGGLISGITIHDNQSQEKIKIEAVSAHLDSSTMQKRNHDWQKLYHGIAKDKIGNWEQLVDALPHLRLSGFDANTRNKLDKQNVENLWITGKSTPEIQALHQATLAGQHFSKSSTYKTNQEGVEGKPDQKRPGYAKGGMLDFVGVADGHELNNDITQNNVIQIGPEADTDRDHDVIICPLQHYNKLNDFDRVKGQIATQLSRAAPELAKEILELSETASNKEKLVHIYQLFLSPKGLLNSVVDFHSKKLSDLGQAPDLAALASKQITNKIDASLFPESPWFSTINLNNMKEEVDKYKQKMQLTQLFINSLMNCQCESAYSNRIQWFYELSQKIDTGAFQKAEAEKNIKEWEIKEFVTHFIRFTTQLQNYKPKTDNEIHFVKMGGNIVDAINAIVSESPTESLDEKSLSELSTVLDQCSLAIDTLKQKGDITQVCTRLGQLSQEVSGKSSSLWQTLGAGLLVFACLTLVLAGVLAAVPTSGTSMLLATGATALVTGIAGIEMLESGSQKDLAKSVANFKTSLKELTIEEPTKEESDLGDKPLDKGIY